MSDLTQRFSAHWDLKFDTQRFAQGSLFNDEEFKGGPPPKQNRRNWKSMQGERHVGFDTNRAPRGGAVDIVTGKFRRGGKLISKSRVSPGQMSIGLDFDDKKPEPKPIDPAEVAKQQLAGTNQIKKKTASGQGLLNLDDHDSLGLEFEDSKGLHIPEKKKETPKPKTRINKKGQREEQAESRKWDLHQPKPPEDIKGYAPKHLGGFNIDWDSHLKAFGEPGLEDFYSEKTFKGKVTGAKRAQSKEQNKKPLLSDQIKNDQEPPEERASKYRDKNIDLLKKSDETDLRKWIEVDKKLDAMPESDRKEFIDRFKTTGQSDPAYALDYIHQGIGKLRNQNQKKSTAKLAGNIASELVKNPEYKHLNPKQVIAHYEGDIPTAIKKALQKSPKPDNKIPGGLAEGKTQADFPQKKLKQGKKVEMEHTTDPTIATEIAMDHVEEDPKYYNKLKKMEKPKASKPKNRRSV